MKVFLTLMLLPLLMLIVSACQPEKAACAPGSIQQVSDSAAFPPSSAINAASPVKMQVGGKDMAVDQVIRGPFCNLHLSGTVYVGCDIQIKEWKDHPDFLNGCDFTYDPNTVIYVAAHNDAAYYNGCLACHAAQP